MKSFITNIKSKFEPETKRNIKLKIINLRAYFIFWNLTKFAKIYKSDKYGGHFYTQHYNYHFKKIRFRKNKILEIGVGGYHNPIAGANSLRMGKKYFPFSKIYAIDIYDKSKLEEKRIKIFKGSQVDFSFSNEVCKSTGDFI